MVCKFNSPPDRFGFFWSMCGPPADQVSAFIADFLTSGPGTRNKEVEVSGPSRTSTMKMPDVLTGCASVLHGEKPSGSWRGKRQQWCLRRYCPSGYRSRQSVYQNRLAVRRHINRPAAFAYPSCLSVQQHFCSCTVSELRKLLHAERLLNRKVGAFCRAFRFHRR